MCVELGGEDVYPSGWYTLRHEIVLKAYHINQYLERVPICKMQYANDKLVKMLNKAHA